MNASNGNQIKLELKLFDATEIDILMASKALRTRIEKGKYKPNRWNILNGTCGGTIGKFRIKESKNV